MAQRMLGVGGVLRAHRGVSLTFLLEQDFIVFKVEVVGVVVLLSLALLEGRTDVAEVVAFAKTASGRGTPLALASAFIRPNSAASSGAHASPGLSSSLSTRSVSRRRLSSE